MRRLRCERQQSWVGGKDYLLQIFKSRIRRHTKKIVRMAGKYAEIRNTNTNLQSNRQTNPIILSSHHYFTVGYRPVLGKSFIL